MTSSIRTSFTKLTGAKTPIVSAAMAGAAGGALAGNVTHAGGFGFLAAGYGTTERLRNELDLAQSILNPSPGSPLPIGIGFLGWMLDKNEALAKEQISLALDYRVQAIWLSFGDRLDYWTSYIRELTNEKSTPRLLIFILVTSVTETETALNVWKADVIVAQGSEAGGHGSANGLPLLALLPSILSVVGSGGPPVLAAGGLVTGAHMAALLALGAAGVVIGTRFLLTPEAQYTETQRNALLAADSSQSVRTYAFDEARGTLGWPKGIDGRALHNATVEDYDRGLDSDTLRKRYQEASSKDDPSRIVVWAGAGVGLITKTQSAKDIVEEIHQECLERINLVATLAS